MNSRQKRIIILVVVVVVLFLGFGLVRNMRFRVLSTTPKLKGAVATDLKTFVIVFNRELAPNVDYKQKLTDPENHVKEIEAEAKRLVLYTNSAQDEKNYKFELNDITAADGSVIRSIQFNYTAKYIPFEKLPKDQQQLIEEQNLRPRADNPILNYLPHGGLHFNLDAVFSEVNEESGELGAVTLVAQLYLSNSDVKINREAAIEKYKKEVLDYIVSIGFDPNNFAIRYEINEAY